MARVTVLITLLAIFVFGLEPCMAQVTTGTIYGTVTDPSGAVVPNATVTLVNEGTGIISEQKSGGQGEFTFTFVPVGAYTLKISAAGFKTSETQHISMQAGLTVRRAFVLDVGAASESITVTATPTLVNTASSEQRQDITTQQVGELPLARRNVIGLAGLSTGVSVNNSSNNNAGTLNFNGLGQGTSSITVDGTNASSNPDGNQMGMFGGFNNIYTISLEAVQEVETTKGVMSAEYSRALGGNLNLITKSGTNEWHGSLFENFQADDLNARNPFLSSKTPFTFNQFGGSIGGPIIKDKLFIFGVYEGVRQAAFSRQVGTVPTPWLRDQMIASTPDYKLALDALPLPTDPYSPTDPTGIYEGVASSRTSENQYIIKPDYWISQSQKVSFTFTASRPNQSNPSLSPMDYRNFFGETNRATASYTFYTAKWTGETRFGYNYNYVDRLDTYHLLKKPGATESIPDGYRMATIKALGFDIGNSEEMINGAPVWSLEQKIATNIGRHSIKFGGIWFDRHSGGSDIESPRVQYSTVQDLINNVPSQVRVTFGRYPFDGSDKNFGFFLQDDWRATPKLTINMGMRYDYFSAFTVSSSGARSANFYNPGGILDSNFTLGPFRPVDSPYSSDPLNVSPRVGLAYNPDGHGVNVIRASAGILFTPLLGQTFSEAIMSSPTQPFRIQLSKSQAQAANVHFPVYNEDMLPLVGAGLVMPSYTVINPDINAPYSINYYFGYERALPSNSSFTTAFVANHGVKFIMRRNYNLPDRVTGIAPNPTIGSGQYYDNSESTHYISWQSTFRKRLSRGLTADVNYTWGKVISYGTGDIISNPADVQDFFDVRAARGPADGDRTHVFNADFVYQLPWLSDSKGFVRSAFGGWQISGIFSAGTGAPLSINESSALDPSRPDVNGLSPMNSNYRDTLQYLNLQAFTAVPMGKASGGPIRVGNLGRNAVRGPGYQNMDFSFGKQFSLTERVKFQLRADMFDALNHVNFTNVVVDITKKNFGQLTAASSRQIQLNGRISF